MKCLVKYSIFEKNYIFPVRAVCPFKGKSLAAGQEKRGFLRKILIGILSAVALPSYNSYVIRARVASAYPTLKKIQQELITKWEETGVLPTSVVIDGTTISISSWTSFNVDPIKNCSL